MRGKGPWVATGVGTRTGVRAGDIVGVVGGAGTRLTVFRRKRGKEVNVASLVSVETVVETRTAPKSSAPGG